MQRIFTYPIKHCKDTTIREYLLSKGYSRHLLAGIKRTPGGILLNGKEVPVSEGLQTGGLLTVTLSETDLSETVQPVPLPLSIVYEDEDLLIVNKPADMPVHPSIHNHENTLANAAVWHFRNEQPFVFRCVSRLDRDTTGLLVIGKNKLAASILETAQKQETLFVLDSAAKKSTNPDAFKEGANPKETRKGASSAWFSYAPYVIERTYLAIVSGKVLNPGTVTAPIGRKPGSALERCVDFANGEPAVTHFFPLLIRDDLGLTLLALKLTTGRTHQIRVHLNYLGHPVIGDFLYHPGDTRMNRQALHSWRLAFRHPITGERMTFQAPLPPDMRFIL